VVLVRSAVGHQLSMYCWGCLMCRWCKQWRWVKWWGECWWWHWQYQ